ncbi:MAG: hypothetical protein IKI53_08530 [Firmicutes bacterium]|nr:hypothetical protein [Bacillota bacterium]
MAERKAREDRVITDIRDQAKTESQRKSAARSKRIVAIILWILAIGCEVAAVILFKKLVVLWPCLLALIVDAILCIVAAQFWKKANHIDPPAGKFWQNQFGAFMAVLAFAPFILILLTSKDVDPKFKKILTVVAALCLVASVGLSIDYNPVTIDDLDEAELNALGYGGECYWARYSKSYHFDPDCPTLLRSKEVFHGTIEQAFEEGRTDPCDFCAGGKEQKENGGE